jgi:putative chitinase
MELNVNQLVSIMPFAKVRVPGFLPFIQETIDRFEIDTPLRTAHFLAQIAHESGELHYTQEIASGSAYEGRRDLGNTEPGDGIKFKGRGLIQITGRSNYLKVSAALYGDPQTLIETPELLETKEAACLSAGWFWDENHLNKWADLDDLDGVSDVINRGHKTKAIGDANGYTDRAMYLARAKAALGV